MADLYRRAAVDGVDRGDMAAVGRSISVTYAAVPVDLDGLVLDGAKRLRTATDLELDTSAPSAAQVRDEEAAPWRMVHNLGREGDPVRQPPDRTRAG